MRARLVLLDADVIIEAFRQGIWNDLVSKVQVFVPQPILNQANFYHDAESGQDRRIDLRPDVEAGRVTVLDATAEALAVVEETCNKYLEIHDGEKHALAALLDMTDEYHFCSGDKAAIQALVLLDKADRSVSMERMLGDAGVRRKEPLAHQFVHEYLQEWLRRGAVLRAESAAL
jgi:hypothetical protein